MLRSFALALLALALVAGAYAPSALAQTCTPACSTDKECIYVGVTGTATQCVPKVQCVGDECTVDEIVITAPARGTSFAQIVNDQIVPTADLIISLLYAIAFLLFLIGILRYFFTHDEENRKKGKAFMLWSIVGLVVLFSVWGFVRLLLSLLPGTGAL